MTNPREKSDQVADYAGALRWAIEQLDLVADAADGVWLAIGTGKVVRPPAEVHAVLLEMRTDER